ncbi:Os11g0474600 [Oryza sativa Japonica Group]|uniref:Os11g0474600 protein n=1 Tax=Oryza sativa subsp. japonica TaxID=39947 RepID=A0A0N7KSX2_ORYSJ|nr:Os11g0474600 [Oryza sativa Japonica Group]
MDGESVAPVDYNITFSSMLSLATRMSLEIPVIKTNIGDGMAQFAEQSSFDNSIHAYLNDIEPLLELYKSSQVRFSEDDLILENIGSWSTKLLKQQLSSKNISKSLLTEVTHALKFPLYATLEPHEHRRNIERFKTNVFQRLKSGYCWVAEFRLEELKFARIMPLQALLTAVSPLFRSEFRCPHRMEPEHRAGDSGG